ncbi:MAG: GGDEF domain-containing protein [Candidatus Latescibacterota bacterium]|nr:MAG: GGDEF domain-containing protein [Candidatus Latescibacterota bacterium]
MRTFDKDYKYLLANLVPRHRLSADRRKQISDAIASGDAAAMRLVSVLALEDLRQSEYFDRSRTQDENGHVILTYIRNQGSYQIRLILPADEWQTLDTTPPVDKRQPPKVSKHTTARHVAAEMPRAPEPVDTSVNILPDIIRSFSINDGRESSLNRLDRVLDAMPSWFRFAWGRLVLLEGRFGERGTNGDRVVTVPESVILENEIYQNCRRSGNTVVVDGARAKKSGISRPPRISPVEGDEVLELAVAPVVSMGEFWGVLEVWVTPEDNGPLLAQRVAIACSVIRQILENSVRLEDLTSIDKLTQVYNRAFYDKQVRIEMERATRSGTKLSLLILDIDDFRTVNNTMGHRKGDEALGAVADLIRENLRKIDIAFRYGGEEFVVLLPGTAEVEAIHTAERLRAVIAEYDRFRNQKGERYEITVSIGAAVFPDHARTEEELFSRADAALYLAKHRGKNRVEFYHPE